MFAYHRVVRFQDVDPAGLLYFPLFLSYAHEAMEELFGALNGGYVGLIQKRKIGLPAVRVETDFRAPLVYGDRVRIEVTVPRLGNRSLTLRYRFMRCHDETLAAEMLHTVVTTDLTQTKSCDMPQDVRDVA